jgi:hypothetical protein
MRLRDVVASVIGVVAGAVDGSGFHKVAAWLRDRADDLAQRSIDVIARRPRRLTVALRTTTAPTTRHC